MSAINRRLQQLRRIETQLRNLGLDYIADDVRHEISSLEGAPKDSVAHIFASWDEEMRQLERQWRGGRR